MTRKCWLLLIIIGIVSLLGQIAGAQISVLFAPPVVDVNIAPGKSATVFFSLFNRSTEVLSFSCGVYVVRQGEKGEYIPLEEGSLESITHFVKIPFNSFNLEAGERREIPVAITVPASTSPGSYTFGFVLTNTHVGNQEVTLRTRLIGLIFLTVRRPGVTHGRSGKYAEIERFEAREEKGGIRFVAFLANRGRYYVEGRGEVQILEQLTGRRVAEIPCQVGRGRVIPENAIGFPALLTKPLPRGRYVAVARIDYGGLRPAEARLSFACEGLKLFDSTSFVQEESEENVPVVLGLQKSVLETKIAPGARRTLSIPVRNDFPLSAFVRASVRDASPLDSARCAGFALVKPETLKIPPYKTALVQVTVAFPKDLSDGDKYLELLLVPEKAGEKALSPELQEASAASVFLIFDNIRGEKVERAEFKKVEVQLAQDESGRLFPHFLVSYKNTGNTHLTPYCRVEVSEIPGEQKGVFLERVGTLLSLRSEPSEDLVLPGMEGNAVLSSNQSILPGKYRLKVSLIQEEKELLVEETTFTVKER